MFNPLSRSNPDDPKKTEPPSADSTTVPADLKPTSANYAADSAGPGAFPALDTAQPQPEPAAGEKHFPNGESAAKPLYPPLPTKHKTGNVLNLMFDNATRTGRFVRTLLRWLAATTGLFALGLLAGYLMLYQPTQADLENTQSQLKQANQALALRDQSLQSAKTDGTQVQQSLKLAQDDLKKAASENEVLMVLVSVSNARVALVLKDGPTAKTAIEQAQAGLTKTQALIESVDKAKYDVLKTRLDLAAKELVSDPQAAQTDLDKLAADLTDLRLKLFKK